MLAYNNPLVLDDWLNYRNPYHDPDPRRADNYYDDLEAPGNAALRNALRQNLMPSDGGKQISRLTWLSDQAQTMENNPGRPLASVAGVRAQIDTHIQNSLLKPQLSADDYQQAQQALDGLIAQLSVADLQTLQTDLAEHGVQHAVRYIQDCSNSYTNTTQKRQDLIDKNQEITQFLANQVPIANSLSEYLSRDPEPANYNDGVDLRDELADIERESMSVLYRIRDVKPLKKNALINALESSGVHNAPVDAENYEAVLNLHIQGLYDKIINTPGDIDSHLYTDPVLTAVHNVASLESQYFIEDLSQAYINFFSVQGNRTDQQEVKKHLTNLINRAVAQHPSLTNFYGIEECTLTSTNGIYTIGRTGHTLDKNMVWAHANIQSGRRFRVNSPLALTSIMRQSDGFEDHPSAFSCEISALITSGYVLKEENGQYYFDPPRNNGLIDTATLANTTLNSIQKDMGVFSDRLNVINNVAAALNQQHAIHWENIEPLSTKYHDAQTLDAIRLDIEQQIAPYKVTYEAANADAEPNLQQMITYLEAQEQARLLNDPDNNLDTIQTDLAQLKEFRTDLASLPDLQDDQDKLDDIRQAQADVQDKAQTLVRAHHQLSDFAVRLNVVQQHGLGNNQPPSTEEQLENATALQTEVEQAQQTIQQYGLNNLNLPEIDTLVQNCQAARQTAFQAHFAFQQQQLIDAQQVEDEQAPDLENGPNGPGVD